MPTIRTRDLPGVHRGADNLFNVAPELLRPGDNPRTEDFDLEPLKASIRQYGFRPNSPIAVYRDGDALVIVDGERRWRAVLAINAEDGQVIQTVPTVVVPAMADPASRLMASLAANRGKSISPSDEARAFQRLVSFGWSVEAIAAGVSYSTEYVRSRLVFLEATPAVVEAQRQGDIGIKDVGTIVRQAARNGTSQAVELATHQATKMDLRKVRSQPVGETILHALARMEDRYGVEAMREAVTRYLGKG